MNYSPNECLSMLASRGVVPNKHKVLEVFNTKPIGIKLWGMIDYLCKFHKYSWKRKN